jgi:hypothetical protein
MGSFLLLLLAQTWLMATGRDALHRQLGALGMVLAVLLIVVGFMLVSTGPRLIWEAANSGAPGAAEKFGPLLRLLENFMLLQMLAGFSFALFLTIGLTVRSSHPGMHKRMMILATAMPLTAAINRIPWLPTTFPESALFTFVYLAVAISPMFGWDVIRNRRVHAAYWVLFVAYMPFACAVVALWDTPWWHAMARQIQGWS